MAGGACPGHGQRGVAPLLSLSTLLAARTSPLSPPSPARVASGIRSAEGVSPGDTGAWQFCWPVSHSSQEIREWESLEVTVIGSDHQACIRPRQAVAGALNTVRTGRTADMPCRSAM